LRKTNEKQRVMEIKIVDAKRREAPTSGYGLMSYQFGERLKAHGHTVHYHDQDPKKEADIWLWIRPPHYIKEPYFDQTKPNVFFTMHEQETFTGWKADWPTLLNKCKAVITPTEWNKEVFIKQGVTVPVFVVPLGVDTKVFSGYKNKKFSVLSVFDGLGNDSARDDWKMMIRAFCDTFREKHTSEVSYTIKSWRINHEGYDNFIKTIPEPHPDINVYEIDLVPEDFNLFYAKHHCFVKASKGEGWSLPTLEALSTGLRILSLPTPAMLTFLNEKNTDFFTDKDTLKDKIWENWRRYRKKRIKIDQWSWREATIKLAKALEDIQVQK
jgi:glycosyltransferase involved in cell wall biosynthesis